MLLPTLRIRARRIIVSGPVHGAWGDPRTQLFPLGGVAVMKHMGSLFSIMRGIMKRKTAKTVKIRVPCIIGADGTWSCAGTSNPKSWTYSPETQVLEDYYEATDNQDQPRHIVYIEADVPVPDPPPEPITVKGECHLADSD